MSAIDRPTIRKAMTSGLIAQHNTSIAENEPPLSFTMTRKMSDDADNGYVAAAQSSRSAGRHRMSARSVDFDDFDVPKEMSIPEDNELEQLRDSLASELMELRETLASELMELKFAFEGTKQQVEESLACERRERESTRQQVMDLQVALATPAAPREEPASGKSRSRSRSRDETSVPWGGAEELEAVEETKRPEVRRVCMTVCVNEQCGLVESPAMLRDELAEHDAAGNLAGLRDELRSLERQMRESQQVQAKRSSDLMTWAVGRAAGLDSRLLAVERRAEGASGREAVEEGSASVFGAFASFMGLGAQPEGDKEAEGAPPEQMSLQAQRPKSEPPSMTLGARPPQQAQAAGSPAAVGGRAGEAGQQLSEEAWKKSRGR